MPLALGETDFQLDPIAGPVEPERHQRQAFLLDRDAEPDDLGLVQQQLALPLGFVIAAVATLVRADMDVDEEGLSPTEPDVALAQVGPAVAQRLDLGADQLDARLKRLQNEVVVEGDPIGCNRRVLVSLLLPH